MIGAFGIWATLLWWAALAVFFVAIVPPVVVLAHRIVGTIAEIDAYTSDILEHGIEVAGNLDPVPEVETTRGLARQVRDGVARYGAAADRLMQEGGRA